MLEVSDKAGEAIKQILAGKEGPNTIRIMLNQGGCCGGPSLGMALDGPQENDETFNEKGVTFLINKELFDEVKPISIDFIESAMGAGFMVQSALPHNDGGCGSGSCSC
jgi:iron-sulfur cluster assembly accessory protein